MPKAKYTGDVEKDFPWETEALQPSLIANAVASDYGDTADQIAVIEAHLMERFKYIYKNNSTFGKKFIRKGDKQRDLLTQYMRHWSEAFMRKTYPVEYARRVPTHESNLFHFTKRP